jgi:hypothetical protein
MQFALAHPEQTGKGLGNDCSREINFINGNRASYVLSVVSASQVGPTIVDTRDGPAS